MGGRVGQVRFDGLDVRRRSTCVLPLLYVAAPVDFLLAAAAPEEAEGLGASGLDWVAAEPWSAARRLIERQLLPALH